jgi:hypothetical protein
MAVTTPTKMIVTPFPQEPVSVEAKAEVKLEPSLVPPANESILTKTKPRQFFIPSFWDIQAIEGGITAVNSVTNDTFTGTREDFSAMLKGL